MGGGAETGDSDQIACEEDAVNGCAASSDTLDKSDSDEEDVRDDEHDTVEDMSHHAGQRKRRRPETRTDSGQEERTEQ